jgi:hypothetical protein
VVPPNHPKLEHVLTLMVFGITHFRNHVYANAKGQRID